MALRNFWANVKVDGYKTECGVGPRNKEGGMSITVYQRDDGEKKTAVKVNCRAINGKLVTEVEIDGKTVGKFTTER